MGKLKKRLKEPSTWASFGVIAVGVGQLADQVGSGVVAGVPWWVTLLGGGAALTGALMSEKGHQG